MCTATHACGAGHLCRVCMRRMMTRHATGLGDADVADEYASVLGAHPNLRITNQLDTCECDT